MSNEQREQLRGVMNKLDELKDSLETMAQDKTLNSEERTDLMQAVDDVTVASEDLAILIS